MHKMQQNVTLRAWRNFNLNRIQGKGVPINILGTRKLTQSKGGENDEGMKVCMYKKECYTM